MKNFNNIFKTFVIVLVLILNALVVNNGIEVHDRQAEQAAVKSGAVLCTLAGQVQDNSKAEGCLIFEDENGQLISYFADQLGSVKGKTWGKVFEPDIAGITVHAKNNSHVEHIHDGIYAVYISDADILAYDTRMEDINESIFFNVTVFHKDVNTKKLTDRPYFRHRSIH